MKRLVILVATALAAVFASFGQVSAAGAMPTPGAPIVVYTYDAPHLSTERNITVTERGPPAVTYNYATPLWAVDDAPHGPLARSQAALAGRWADCDHLVQLAQITDGPGTARTEPSATAGDVRALSGAIVAAKGAAVR